MVQVNTVQTVVHVKTIQPVVELVNINRQMVQLISHVVHVLMLVELEQKRLQRVRLTPIEYVQHASGKYSTDGSACQTILPVVMAPNINRQMVLPVRISRVPRVPIVERVKKKPHHVRLMPIEHVKIAPLVNTVRIMETVKTIQPLVMLVNINRQMEPLQLISRVPIATLVLTV